VQHNQNRHVKLALWSNYPQVKNRWFSHWCRRCNVKIRAKSMEIWAKCLKAFAKRLYVLWFYKNGTQN